MLLAALLLSGATLMTLHDVTALNSEALLLRHILNETNYDRRVRPQNNGSSELAVAVDVAVNGITEFNEKREDLTTICSIILAWQDQRLAWSSQVLEGAPPAVSVPASELWLPEVLVLNSYDHDHRVGDPGLNLAVHQDGMVLWLFLENLRTSCSMQITKYPFDVQQCDLIFVSHLEFITRVHLIPGDQTVLKSLLFQENSEWDLTNLTVINSVITQYRLGELRVRLTLERRSDARIMFEVVPVVILSLLNPFVFLLPAESGEKMSLAVTVLLSFVIFLTSVANTLPPSSIQVCVYAAFLQFLVAASATCIVLECLVVRLRWRRRPPTQPWLTLLAWRPGAGCTSKLRSSPVDAGAAEHDVSQHAGNTHVYSVTALSTSVQSTSSVHPADVTEASQVPAKSEAARGTSSACDWLSGGSQCQEEWREIANVLDNVAFVVYLTLVVSGWTVCLVILSQAP